MNREPIEIVRDILFELKDNNILGLVELVKPTNASTIKRTVENQSEHIKHEWIQPLVATIKDEYKGFMPKTRQELMELAEHHPVVNKQVINQLLEDIGFFPGLVLDMDCRILVTALEMVDNNEFLEGAGVSLRLAKADAIEASIKTWLAREDWARFPKVLTSINHILHFPAKKDQLKTIQKRIKKDFSDDSSELLLRMVSIILSVYNIDI